LTAVLRNIQNNDLYRHLENNVFRNIRTGQEGTMSDEMAQKVFKINVEATEICNEYPLVEEFIKALNLKSNKT
jgi:hypothetical protein